MFKNKKKRNIIILSFVFIWMIAFIPNLMSNPTFVKNDSEFSEDIINKKEKNKNPKISNYTPSYNATGGNFNVTLHQSIINTTKIQIINTSDIDNITFYEKCPTEPNFNTSLINITIESIFAPNKTLIVENEGGPGDSDKLSDKYFASFNVSSKCIIKNVSVRVKCDDTDTFYVDLFNASLPGDDIKYQSDLTGGSTLASFGFTGSSPRHWENCTDIDFEIDPTNTYQNVFFISLQTLNKQGWWHYEDTLTNGNDSITWTDVSANPLPWRDMELILDLVPINNTPNPQDIGFNINNSAVTGYSDVNGSGYWSSTDEFSSSSGHLEFNMSADWWDVSCNITKRLINYTESDLNANSEYNISGSGNLVIWNVTIPNEIDVFENSDFKHNYINFTIPSSWELIQAFNGTDEKPNSTWDRGDSWQLVNVLDGGNGTFWGLNASSTNLISHIRLYKESTQITSVNFSDTVDFKVNFSEDISGIINLSVYFLSLNNNLNHTNFNNTSPAASLINLGSWKIQENASRYGEYTIQAIWSNDTAAGFLEESLLIFGETETILIEPNQYKEFLNTAEKFNITFFFNDTVNDTAINGATINYSIAGQAEQQTSDNNGTAGYYNITIDPKDAIIKAGLNNVTIYVNKTYYNNQTLIYYFKKVNATNLIGPFPSTNITIYKQNATFQINYSTTTGIPLNDSTIKLVEISPFTIWSYTRDAPTAPGNYTIKINTTGIDIGDYQCTFRISSPGNHSQNIVVNIRIIQATTEILLESYNPTLVRWMGQEQTLIFKFYDTDNEELIINPPGLNFTVYRNATGTLWPGGQGTLQHLGAGRYELKVGITGLDSGYYTMVINATLIPNYKYDLETISFYIRGNYSDIGLLEVNNPGGVITPSGGKYYTFVESDISIEFNYSNTEIVKFLIVPEASIIYRITYEKGPLINGTLSLTNLSGFEKIYDQNTNSHKGNLGTSGLGLGEYNITIEIANRNYENATTIFTIVIIGKFDVNATLLNPPESVTAGESFKITVKIEYLKNDSVWSPVSSVNIRCIVLINGLEELEYSNSTNSEGIVQFTITLPLEARNMTITIKIFPTYNTVEKTKEFSSIMVNPPPVIPIEIVLILLIISAVVAVGAISYKVFVVPRKKRKREAIMEVATAFDDAINLEQLLVLHKGSGTCIFFKSFGGETIDPDLISGFLSAVQSFGKEIKYQQSLNEITYGDKMLLLSDGENIRVALVLGKKGSMVLRRNLTRFIKMFEGRFGHVLPEWRGDLQVFRDSDDLIDQAFNTSIILPHEINTDVSKIKLVKSPLARRLLKLAQDITVEKQRKYFFLASLLNEATDKVGEEAAELFVAIKELRDNEAIIPIKIDKIAPEAISQQELNILGQKVAQLGGYTPEQKQSLVQELAHMKPAEREAFFSSLIQGEAIVSAPVRIEETSVEISDAKSAKTEMKNLESKAKELIKGGDLSRAIQIYENTAILAETWNFLKESKMLKEKAREVSIKNLENEMKNLVKDAENAVKGSQYIEASEKYIQAARKASEIFKLGETSMQKQVRLYENKAKEYEKYIK